MLTQVALGKLFKLKPLLGLSFNSLSNEDKDKEGIQVLAVVEGCAASSAGLRPHDLILECSGQPVGNREDFRRINQSTVVGNEVPLLVKRRNKFTAVVLTVGARKTPPEEIRRLRLIRNTRVQYNDFRTTIFGCVNGVKNWRP